MEHEVENHYTEYFVEFENWGLLDPCVNDEEDAIEKHQFYIKKKNEHNWKVKRYFEFKRYVEENGIELMGCSEGVNLDVEIK